MPQKIQGLGVPNPRNENRGHTGFQTVGADWVRIHCAIIFGQQAFCPKQTDFFGVFGLFLAASWPNRPENSQVFPMHTPTTVAPLLNPHFWPRVFDPGSRGGGFGEAARTVYQPGTQPAQQGTLHQLQSAWMAPKTGGTKFDEGLVFSVPDMSIGLFRISLFFFIV